MAGRSYCAEQVRQYDSDRYLTALFAPPDRRQDLLALYAFNAEVARSREAVSEPMLGRIRLQWWREAIAECYGGEVRRHQVVEPLAEAIRRRGLSRNLFDALLDAREADMENGPPESLEELVRYAEESSGGLTRLALEILDVRDDASQSAGGLVGTAWALTGMMRALPFHLRQGRSVLPRDIMARHGVDEGALRALKPSESTSKAVEKICSIALEKIEKSRVLMIEKESRALPALLPGVLAETYLRRLSRLGHDPFDRGNAAPLRFRSWRVILRALRGRI